jgi:cytochrome c biogenesis protein CcdA
MPEPARAGGLRSRRYVVLATATVAFGLIGYLAYLAYPRFELPAARGLGLLLLAAGAGAAGFFSPCSFPLLVTLLARSADTQPDERASVRGALRFGAALSLGAVVFVMGVGALIGLGGAGVASSVTFTSPAGRALRGVVGVLLVVLGLIQVGRLRVDLRGAERAVHGFLGSQAALRRRHPTTGYVVFGFGYLAAGFG